ncbi:MAG: DNA protecting protein DprA [marine bacterium B5-7]|nr:MAG: DNA protecting protein DprA [marine bacterium B5-7]
MDMDTAQNYTDWLSLTQAIGIGPATCNKLLIKFKTPAAILSSSHATLKLSGLNDGTINSLFEPDQVQISAALEWLNQPNHHLITILDDDYPALLKLIHSPPVIMFAVGCRRALGFMHFAIVGSRNPTAGGKKLAEDFAAELSRAGLSICSGLALGIDYHSHLGTLKADGSTIAILGNGLNSIYPARHKKIARQIIENGLLLSEYLPDTNPSPGNFPRRNRIISGMSMGVLVVEAAKRSGSLITANYALEQGRDVFAIPGSIHNPLARGTHSLIKQGAKLVETIDDILEDLSAMANVVLNSSSTFESSPYSFNDLEPDYKLLLNRMGYEIVSVDRLVELTGLTADVVSSMLLILELQGVIEAQHGGKYSRCS